MSNNAAIHTHLDRFLQTREPPKTFCPSEVARALSPAELRAEGATAWRDLMPTIRQIAWQQRAEGVLEVLQRGSVLGPEVELEQIRGPIRIRRCHAHVEQ